MMRVNQYRPDFAIVWNGTPFITGGTWRRNIIHIRLCTCCWERGRSVEEGRCSSLLEHSTILQLCTVGAKSLYLEWDLTPKMRNFSQSFSFSHEWWLNVHSTSQLQLFHGSLLLNNHSGGFPDRPVNGHRISSSSVTKWWHLLYDIYLFLCYISHHKALGAL